MELNTSDPYELAIESFIVTSLICSYSKKMDMNTTKINPTELAIVTFIYVLTANGIGQPKSILMSLPLRVSL